MRSSDSVWRTSYGSRTLNRGKNVDLFRKRLNENCTLTEEELLPKIVIDVPMPVSYLSRELTEQLKILEPFGKGNTSLFLHRKG